MIPQRANGRTDLTGGKLAIGNLAAGKKIKKEEKYSGRIISFSFYVSFASLRSSTLPVYFSGALIQSSCITEATKICCLNHTIKSFFLSCHIERCTCAIVISRSFMSYSCTSVFSRIVVDHRIISLLQLGQIPIPP